MRKADQIADAERASISLRAGSLRQASKNAVKKPETDNPLGLAYILGLL